MSFTTAELILLILIVSIILIIFIILTISEIKDYLNVKKRLLLTGDDSKEEIVINKPVVNKTVVNKEPIVLNVKEDNNVILEEEEVLIPKPKKSEIIIEEEEEYYDPFFDEEDIVLTKPKEIKEEIYYKDVINEEEVEKDINKVKDIINIEDNRIKETNKNVEVKINNYEDTITNFEMEQEENAIISLDELSKISDRIYEENEPIQYDDTDAPITIDEIMRKYNDVEKPSKESVVITTKDVIKEDKLDTFEEEEEEDFLTDLSRAHRKMSR